MERTDIIDKLIDLKKGEKPVIGCFPLYPPLELIHAMGGVPIVLWGLRGVVGQTPDSDKHLQAYTCSVARHLTQFLLSEGKDLMDGVFMYNACDTLRNLPEIITQELSISDRLFPLIRMHVPMAPPSQTDTGDYFKDEIHSVINLFEKHFGVSFSEKQFLQSVGLYNQMRKLASLADQKVTDGNLSFLSFTRVIRDNWFLPVEQQIESLERFLDKNDHRSQGSSGNAKKNGVILSGILPPPESVISAVEAAGLTVVGNDIALMNRSYADMHEETTDPVAYYKKFYFSHYPCPTLLYTGDSRLKTLVDLIGRTQARGVIFVGEKFCEYEYFEFPYIEERLREQGIQTLQIEISIEDEEQTSAYNSRIEAFAEIMRSSFKTSSKAG